MKHLFALLAAALAFPVVAAAAPVVAKPAFDRAAVIAPDSPAPWLPDATGFPSAIALDATFSGNAFGGTDGMNFYDGNSGGDDAEYGIRTFLSRDGGYAYVVGRHVRSSGAPNDAFIVRIKPDGGADTSFGSNGKKYVSVPFPIADVAMDPGGVFYFTGPIVTPPFTDSDFAVYCVVDDGTPCDGFGSNGLTIKAIDLNGHNNDVPWGIVYDALGSVFVFGYSNTAGSGTNDDVAVVKFNATTGAIVQTFGNHAGAAVFGFDYATDGSDIPYAALLTYPASPTGVYRLYVAGSLQRGDANDTDGFVIALDPSTGAYDTAFHNGPVIVYADLGATIKYDAFTSLTELHDGHLLLAGDAQDDAGDYKLLLAKLNATGGGKDGAFCGGGSCVNELVTGNGAFSFPLSHFVYPRGVAERPGNHDLVLALTVKNDVLSGDNHVFQEAVEIGPGGNGLRTWTALDYTATSTPRDSYPYSILVDNGNRVLVTGSRQWNSATGDWDMTLARLVDTDTIFVDSFEAH